MTPREIFGIVVRTFGLATVLYGLNQILGAIFLKLAMQSAEGAAFGNVVTSITGGSVSSMVWTGILTIAVGLFLLLGARTVVDLSYGKQTEPKES